MKLFLNQRDGRMIEALNLTLLQYAEPHRLARGYMLRNRIMYFDIPDNWVVRTSVSDRPERQVAANFINPESSACSCGNAPYCEHVLAIVFQVYERFGVSVNALLTSEVREILNKVEGSGATAGEKRSKSNSSSLAGTRQPAKANAAPPKQAAPPPKPAGPEQTGTVASWREHFERKFPLIHVPSSDSIENLYKVVAENTLLPLAKGWSPIPRTLYHLQLILFILEMVDRSYAQSRNTYYAYMGMQAYSDLQERIWEHVQSLNKSFSLEEAWLSHADLVSETAAAWVKSATSNQGGCVWWLDFFRLVWWCFLNFSALADDERVRLRRLLRDPAIPEWKSKRLHLMIAHLDVAANNDQQAIQALAGAANVSFQIEDFLLYMQTFLADRSHERALAWLHFGQKWLGNSRTPMRERYWQNWEALSRWLPIEAEWEQALRSELPREKERYAAFLLKRGRYRQWAELQLLYVRYLDEMDRDEVRLVTAQAPESLLPLYLKDIERLIGLKNRDAYKEAVRWLKKVRALYNKRKATAQWQVYLDKLLDRHSRLRALREEVEKGKLLS